jgi:hypothetical protein
VSVDRLREAVRARAETTSMRSVASEIGMTPQGLTKFLRGSRPYSATYRKLIEWYVRRSASERRLSAETVTAALSLLVSGLPGAEQADALRSLRESVQAVYAERGVAVPDMAMEAERERLKSAHPSDK